MTNRGRALMGTGYGKGDRRAVEAAEMAINSPLLEDVAIDGAQGILVNITGGPDLGMMEVSEAVTMIEDSAHEDAHIIFGYVTLDEPCDEVKITVIATGFQDDVPSAGYQQQKGAAQAGMQPGNYYRNSSMPAPAMSSSMPSRSSEAPEQVTVQSGGGRVNTAHRGVMTSEKDLDIPAFIRRNSEGQ
jgi:cell division protein FtsZ